MPTAAKAKTIRSRKPAGRLAALVGEDFGVDEAAMVVNGHVETLVAALARPMAADASLGEARIEALAASVRDAAELLDVEMHEFAGLIALVTDDRPGRTVHGPQDREAVASEHP